MHTACAAVTYAGVTISAYLTCFVCCCIETITYDCGVDAFFQQLLALLQ